MVVWRHVMRWVMLVFSLLAGLPVAGESLLVVRGDGDYPPYESIRGGKLSGSNIELVQAAAAEAGYQLEIRSVAWTRALEMVRLGLADAVTFVSKTVEREAYILYLPDNILTPITFGLFGKAGGNWPKEWGGDLTRLKGLRIGTLRNYAYPEVFRQADFLNRFESPGDNTLLLKNLLAGRVDLVISDINEFRFAVSQGKVHDQVVELQPAFPSTTAYLGFSKARGGEAASRIAAAMATLRRRGDYQQILQRHQNP